MLDPAFEYCREEIDGLPSRQNLIRDRYRVLWDIYIEARLIHMGLGDAFQLTQLRRMFARAFSSELENCPSNSFEGF